ncbi:MAG: hypothetical protein JRZ95_02505 [Nitrososphaerota archaeon]|nr:hypothetical protein [Nitrososphaerota archaeon]
MKKKIFLYIGFSIVSISIVVSVSLILNDEDKKFNTLSLPELEFTYDDSNSKLKEKLEFFDISMSKPIKLINRNYLEEFCTFFENEDLQNQVDYCTSTELRDSEGKYLGNIHMVGSRQMPKIILALIQTGPFMQNLDDVKTVYNVVIEDLVCDCWNEVQPGDIETVAGWVDKQRDFHTSDTKPTSKSNLSLSGMQLQMELTTNTEGYLWKLLISG